MAGTGRAELPRDGPAVPGTVAFAWGNAGQTCGAWSRMLVPADLRGIADGATVVAGGAGRPEGFPTGAYVRPTVFADVAPDAVVAQEEIFGPVLVVIPYTDDDHAVEIANSTVYGVNGAVSGPEEHALAVARRLRAGQVDINGAEMNFLAPFGGYKQSGNGREMGRYGMEEFLEVKAVMR